MTPLSRILLRSPTRSRRLIDRFRRADRGVAILEFAVVAPLLITLLYGGFETARYVTLTRRLTYLAGSVAQILAENQTGIVDWTDVLSAQDSAMITFPTVLKESSARGTNWWQYISVSMASVAFTPTVPGCTQFCTYKAYVAWNYGGNARPCGVALTPAPNASTSTPTTLPTDVYGPGSLVVVDIQYPYTPVVGRIFFGSKTIRQSFYVQPRYVSLIKYVHIWTDPFIGAGACPGY